MQNALKIAVWNSNGLTNHIQEIKIFLDEKKIDVMLISEAHLTDKNYIKIPKYTVHYTKHPNDKAHGGTAIIIKSNIKHHELNKFSEKYLQSTSIVIDDWLGNLTLSAVYCPPGQSINENNFNTYFSSLGHKFIAGGDFNCKHHHWGSRIITTRGRQLLKSIIGNNLQHISTGEPTYWPTDPNKTPDLLDFCVIKGISLNYLAIQSCWDLSSDHSPILIDLDSKVILRNKPPVLTNNQTNWNIFRSALTEQISTNLPLKTEIQIENAVQQLTTSIQKAGWSATPEQTLWKETINCSLSAKNMIEEKRKLRRKWQNTHAPIDKENLNRITRRLKNLLKEEKNRGIQTYLENLTPFKDTNYSLWKATRKVKGPKDAIPPLKNAKGKWARTDTEKSETFAEHLSTVFSPFTRVVPLEQEEPFHSFLEAPYQMELPISKFNIKEVKQIINNEIQPNKAPGFDLITGKVLQELTDDCYRIITMIFNAMLSLHYFPLQWKVAQIILIQKPGKDPKDVNSYRPISLLPVISKVFEKLLLRKIKPILEEKSLIPDHQFGFRNQHSTIEQVHRLYTTIRTSLENKQYCTAAFLDASQAFDKVWHTGLLYKLKKNLPYTYFKLLQSYLTERRYLVKYSEAYTKLYPILSGVPQGSVLGPILYLIYTADLPTSNDLTLATFADDTAFLASHGNPIIASERLQLHLNKTNEWLKLWRIRVNPSKSTHITFTLRRGTCPELNLDGHPLPQKDDVKYLGIHLDKRLTWTKHIWTKRLQLGIVYRKLYWMLGKNSHLSIDNKLLIYKTIIKPIWTYGSQLWGSASKSNIMKIQRFQSKTLRTIANAPWYIHNDAIHRDLQVLSVSEECKKSSEQYQNRLRVHPNTLAHNLLNKQQAKRLKRYDPLDLPNRS